MRLEDFTWAFHKVLGDWRDRRPKQIRETLPPAYTSSTLRHIRINACRHAAPKVIECAKWSQTDPFPPDPGMSWYPRSKDKQEGPFLLTADYVCDQCKHPEVTNDMLVSKLCLDQQNADFSPRTLQRYMNSEEPMPVDQFRRAVANAFGQGWLSLWQILSIWQHIDQMVTTRKGLLAVFRRALERKDWRERREIHFSPAEIERELEKQARLLDSEAARMIDQRFRAGNLPPEIEQLMREVLFTDKRKP